MWDAGIPGTRNHPQQSELTHLFSGMLTLAGARSPVVDVLLV